MESKALLYWEKKSQNETEKHEIYHFLFSQAV